MQTEEETPGEAAGKRLFSRSMPTLKRSARTENKAKNGGERAEGSHSRAISSLTFSFSRPRCRCLTLFTPLNETDKTDGGFPHQLPACFSAGVARSRVHDEKQASAAAHIASS